MKRDLIRTTYFLLLQTSRTASLLAKHTDCTSQLHERRAGKKW